jgi:nitrate/nitrite transport system substrate-binding protein
MHLPQSVAFSRPSSNRPRESHAIGFLTLFRRWGLLFGEPDYSEVAASVMRTDLYEEVVDALGINDPAPIDGPEAFFDGCVFDPESPADYLRSLDCVHLQG